jgi:hypothetical protein
MHAEVFPVPTAPRIMLPVYNPRWGMVSHVGAAARPGVVSLWVAPSTRLGCSRVSGSGYGGRSRPRAVGARRYTTIASTEVRSDARKNGVVNQNVAWPYAST